MQQITFLTNTNFQSLKLQRILEKEGISFSVKSTVSSKQTIDKLLWAVCRYFAKEESHLKSPSRKRVYVYPRQVFFYLSDTLFGKKYSLKTCGRFMGGRDHSTVIHGRDVIAGFLSLTNMPIAKQVQTDIDAILNLINS